jgi:glutathione S-transferase
MRRTLYGLSQSPWTERARWALDHHGATYQYHEHVPMLGEVFLRAKARVKKASVPLLVDGDTVVMGSFEIAKHAEAIGRGAALFPRNKDAQVAHFIDIAERISRIARGWVLRRLMASPKALAEALPSFIPGPLRGISAPTTKMALSFLIRKYDATADDDEVNRTLRSIYEDIRAELAGDAYLLGTFSVADIAIASTIQGLRPRPDSLPPATAEAWTNEVLAPDFADLLRWRDEVYKKHR